MSNPQYTQQLNTAAATVKQLLAAHPALSKPRVLVICGSGLGGIANILDTTTKLEVPYSQIPGFKTSTVPGHAGKLVFGLIGSNKVPVMCMVGRLHSYEGYSLRDTTFPVRLSKLLGVDVVVVTNAAGGVNSEYKPGDLMIINDHIDMPGLGGLHALKGENLDEFGPRFQPLSDAYELKLRKLFFSKKIELGITRNVFEGTYCFVFGPTFETRAECRFLRSVGADAVGMSTVPEVTVARHCGMRVLALSLITNAALVSKPASVFDENPTPLDEGMPSHEEVLQAADEASKDVQKIFEATINEIDK